MFQFYFIKNRFGWHHPLQRVKWVSSLLHFSIKKRPNRVNSRMGVLFALILFLFGAANDYITLDLTVIGLLSSVKDRAGQGYTGCQHNRDPKGDITVIAGPRAVCCPSVRIVFIAGLVAVGWGIGI